MKVIDGAFFEKVEKTEVLVPNKYEPLERTSLDLLHASVEHANSHLKLYNTVLVQKCKQIVIGNLRDLVVLNEDDVYINMHYPNGWFALFKIDGVSYFFIYNYISGSWDLKKIEKSPDDKVEEIYGRR